MAEIKKIGLDCADLINKDDTITIGQMIENHLVPSLVKSLGKAQYMVDVNGYPCIVLPCADGEFNELYNPVIGFATASTLVAKGASPTAFAGIIDMSTKTTYRGYFASRYRISTNSSDNTDSGSTSIAMSYAIEFWACEYDGITSYGITDVGTDKYIQMLSMDILVVKLKDIKTSEQIDGLLITSGVNKNNLTLIYPYDGSVVTSTIPQWVLPTRTKAVSMYQLNDGNVVSDKLYACFPSIHTVLSPLYTFDSTKQPVYVDTWNKSAVTIDGKKFDLKLSSASSTAQIALASISQE